MKRPTLLLALLFVAAGSHGETQLPQRVAAWERQVAAEIPNGTSKGELAKWAVAHGFAPAWENEVDYVRVLERVKGDGLVCSHWSILLSVKLRSERVVESRVSKAGTCL